MNLDIWDYRYEETMIQQSEIKIEDLIKPVKKAETALAVEARGLIKVFGDNRAVDGIDISIPPGCIYGLLRSERRG